MRELPSKTFQASVRTLGGIPRAQSDATTELERIESVQCGRIELLQVWVSWVMRRSRPMSTLFFSLCSRSKNFTAAFWAATDRCSFFCFWGDSWSLEREEVEEDVELEEAEEEEAEEEDEACLSGAECDEDRDLDSRDLEDLSGVDGAEEQYACGSIANL